MLVRSKSFSVALEAEGRRSLRGMPEVSSLRACLKAGITHRKPLRTAKATDPKELLMVLAPSVGSSKGHYQRIRRL